MNAKSSSLLAVLAVAVPGLASAATLQDTLVLISGLMNAFIPILITAALLAFFWGLVKYIYSEDKKEGLGIMGYGLLALFVMVSVWGLIRLLQSTFKVTGNEPIVPKGIPLR
jgi:hypothetical protein